MPFLNYLHNHMQLTSSAFNNGDPIPPQYTCDGIDINPPLEIKGVPKEAKSLVLIVDDPDAPSGTWVHWLVWNISPNNDSINEHFVPAGAVEGVTSFGKPGWGGPCPPGGMHRYYFHLFALDSVLTLPVGANRLELESAMDGHVIDEAELMGTYERETM